MVEAGFSLLYGRLSLCQPTPPRILFPSILLSLRFKNIPRTEHSKSSMKRKSLKLTPLANSYIVQGLMVNFAKTFSDYGKALERIFYPPTCQLCLKDLSWFEETICESCKDSFRKLQASLCSHCAKELGPFSAKVLCDECLSAKPCIEKTWAIYSFNPPLRKFFHRIKFGSRCSPLGVFREEIRSFAEKNIPGIFSAIVPVPLDWKRQWIRGFNQSKILASFLSEALDCPLAELLEKNKTTCPQSILSKQDRGKNMRGSFRCKNRGNLDQGTLLLVDDIYTTGNTVKECGRVLKENGARRVYAFALARAGLEGN